MTDSQQAYLQGLRHGNPGTSLLKMYDEVTADALKDFANFQEFLKDYGHPDPQASDLYLMVTRKNFLRMLYYADDRDRRCLILQNCFGFDRPPVLDPSGGGLKEVGQLVLIQKGNFQQIDGQSDEDFFDKDKDTIFRDANENFEQFISMDIDHLSNDQAEQYADNFRKMYVGRSQDSNPFILGYLLPAKALINLLTDPNYSLGRADVLTFRWGLATYNLVSGIGNFTLIIGTGDVLTGPTIEFRTVQIPPSDNDCPPHSGCAPKR